MLDIKLIENALALTGNTLDLIYEIKTIVHWSYWHEPFNTPCIEKFCYYLLSPEFIDKYYPIAKAYLEEKYFPIDTDTEE